MSAINDVVQSAQASLSVAEAQLAAAQRDADSAGATLQAANAALTTATVANQLGTEAAETIARVGLNGLVSIREIVFDESLSVADGGAVTAFIRASFLGQADHFLFMSINLRDITAIARDLAEQIGNGFSSLF